MSESVGRRAGHHKYRSGDYLEPESLLRSGPDYKNAHVERARSLKFETALRNRYSPAVLGLFCILMRFEVESSLQPKVELLRRAPPIVNRSNPVFKFSRSLSLRLSALMRQSIVFACVIGTVFAPFARGDETNLRLTWNDAVQLAIKANGELLSDQAKAQSSEYQIGHARAGYLPVLTGTLGFGRQSGTFDGLSAQATVYDASLVLSQNLFTGLGDFARIRQAKAFDTAAEAKLQITKSRISFELKSAYQNLLYAKSGVELSEGILRRRENNLKMVSLRYEGGRENKGAVLLSQAYLEEARLQLLQARNAVNVADATFRKLLGIDDAKPIEATDVVPTTEPSRDHIDFRAVAALTPVFEQAVADEAWAKQELSIKRSGFFPTLNLTGGTSRSDETFVPQNPRWSVGLVLSMPLFNGGRDYYASEAATQNYLAAARLRENVQRTQLQNLETAYSEYADAVARLRTNEAFRDALRVRAKIAKAKYNQGLLSFDDWDVIENDLVDRERNYLTSSRDRVIKEAAWEQSQGRGAIP